MIVYYDPLSVEYKSVTGAISDKERLIISIKIDGGKDCKLFVRDDETGEESTFSSRRDGEFFRFELPTLKSGLYFYCFVCDGVKIGKSYYGFGEIGAEVERFQLLVYKSGFSRPTKLHGKTIYQIFPDRFARVEGYGSIEGRKFRSDWGGVPNYKPDENGKIKNDDFFGGNFEGIRRKVDYLKELGVDYVYLNPVCKAYSNHRYDAGDYMLFDDVLGNDDDFSSLVKTLKNADISVIFDGVFNHTGDDSVYFNKYGNYPSVGAYQSEDSPYRNWYCFEEYPNEYRSWWGIDVLPTINKDCEEFENFILGDGGVLDRYFSLGVDGVRLDVADELPDEFIRKIRSKAKEYGDDKIVIGEVWEDATNKIAYGKRRKYFQGGELDSQMNYPLKDAIVDYVLNGNASALFKVVREQIDHFPPFELNSLMNILGTHDTPRILTVLGERGRLKQTREEMANEVLTDAELSAATAALKCASLLQYSLYGVPCLYYGDEQFAQGNKDPFNRRCFSESENKELFAWYSGLSRLRKSFDCFRDGKTQIEICSGGLFCFSRTGETSKVYVCLNCGDIPVSLTFDGEVYEATRDVKLSKIRLDAYDFAIFYKRKNQ